MTPRSDHHPAPCTTDPVTSNSLDTYFQSDHRRIVLVDDLRGRSYRLWASLNSLSDNNTISTVESAEEAMTLISRPEHDLVLVAFTLGNNEGLRFCQRLKRRPEPLAVFLYHDHVDDLLAGAAAIAGADGVFAADLSAERLAVIGRRVVGPEPAAPSAPSGVFSAVTRHIDERDRAIAAMLLERRHPDDIARLLGISASALRLRHQTIIDRLDAALAARLATLKTCEPALQHTTPTPASRSGSYQRRPSFTPTPVRAARPVRPPRRPVSVAHA